MTNHILSQQDVHLIDYLNIIRKRKWLAIIFFLMVVSIIVAWSFHTTPIYKATTQISIENKDSLLSEMADVSTKIRAEYENRSYVQTQCKLLASRSLARDVINELELRKYFKPDEADHTTEEQDAPSVSPKAQDDTRIINWYLSNLQIAPLRDTHLVYVSFQSASPEMAALIANTHSRVFIERNNHLQHLASRQALDWLKQQLFNQKIEIGTSQKAEYEYKYKQLQSFTVDDESIFSIPEVEQNIVIKNLYAKFSELKAEKSLIATRYGPKHHKIIELDSSMGKLEQGIMGEIQNIRKAIRGELNRIAAFEKINQPQPHASQQGAKPHSEKAVNYDMVRLEAESDKVIYDVLLKRAKEINLTGNMERSNIRIVDEAEAPLSPIKPRILLNILLSVVVGLTLGAGLCFFLEYMDKTVRTSDDVARYLRLPVLGVIPYDKALNGGKTPALSWNNGHPDRQKPLKEAYASYDISGSFVARLPLLQSGMHGQAYLVESTIKGEGKTTVLAKLALNLAKGGLRVIMVDADLHHPSLHKVFGLENGGGHGLLNAMEGGVMSQNILQGDLKEYSVDDLFSIISLKKLSGQLVVNNEAQSMTALFQKGYLFQIQSRDVPFANRLGTMLLRGGFITDDQLKDALERNQRTGMPIGYILINAGYVNQEQLKGPLKLQMEEHLQKLFSWKHGTFTFEPGNVEVYEDKKIYFEEDYTPIIKRLGHTAGSRFLKREIFSHVQHLNGSNISLLPAGTGRINPDSPLYCALLSKFLYFLKQQYDVVLVDAPPMSEAINTAVPLLNCVDGTIFVVKSGQVSHDAIRKVATIIEESKTRILGVVLNQAKTGGYYY